MNKQLSRRSAMMGAMLLVGAALLMQSAVAPTSFVAAAATPFPTPSDAVFNDIQMYDPTCLSSRPPHYYAYAEGKRQDSDFGPSADIGDVDVVVDELVRRLCGSGSTGGDPRLAAAISSVMFGRDPNRPMAGADWETTVEVLFAILRDPNTSFKISSLPFTPGSMTMVMTSELRGADPTVSYVTLGNNEYRKYLSIGYNNDHIGSGYVELLLSCGFQPAGPQVNELDQLYPVKK